MFYNILLNVVSRSDKYKYTVSFQSSGRVPNGVAPFIALTSLRVHARALIVSASSDVDESSLPLAKIVYTLQSVFVSCQLPERWVLDVTWFRFLVTEKLLSVN